MARVVPESQDERMDFCSENETQFYAEDHPGLAKAALTELAYGAMIHPGAGELDVRVRISQNASARGFRKAAIIVVATGRRKKPCPGQLFTDQDLIDILNVVLEPVDVETRRGFTYAADSVFRFSEDICCDIQDIAHKSFVLQPPPPPAQLLALYLQGANMSHAVKLQMSTYRPKPGTRGGKIPTALNIKGSRFYLSCVMKDKQPVLQLEEASLSGDLDQAKLGRFLFYRITETHTRFESAAFPGWFICTCGRPDLPVGITDQVGGELIVDYQVTE